MKKKHYKLSISKLVHRSKYIQNLARETVNTHNSFTINNNGFYKNKKHHSPNQKAAEVKHANNALNNFFLR